MRCPSPAFVQQLFRVCPHEPWWLSRQQFLAYATQAKLDLSDEQRAQLAAGQRRYQGAFSALAKERSAINSALVNAAAPCKDGLKKARRPAVRCLRSFSMPGFMPGLLSIRVLWLLAWPCGMSTPGRSH